MTARTATALRVLATAEAAALTVDRPTSFDVFGHGLAPAEVRWLCDGMPDAELLPIVGALVGSEDMQLVGTLIGRTVRVLLVSRSDAGLIGDLALVLARRARALAKAAAR